MLSCLFTAFFATAAAFLLQTALQKFTNPTHAGLIFIMEPVFAAMTSAVWEHEYMSYAGTIGCLLILLGMGLSEWRPKKHKKSHKTSSF
ncbi:EamA family transporter [Scopulibacillus daqui]|uniref:EamA family transporter n=1 Tax=Scopulibacillus daqui TaxID=1469162 RepID=UPI0023BA84A4|nr:EamA family transporter [Scopulibacillus daqui]